MPTQKQAKTTASEHLDCTIRSPADGHAPPAGLELLVSGRVQGVGFRSFVYRAATRLGLTGWVRNEAGGVRLRVWGAPEALDALPRLLREDAPPLARIEAVEVGDLPVAGPPAATFTISPTATMAGTVPAGLLVSPDVGPCDACLAEMHSARDRRHNYPFTNCTQCGPRFSIIRSMPYDRGATSMACFALCPDCAREYANPADRRFHAQPNACPVCGPRLWLADAHGRAVPASDPLAAVAAHLAAGGIAAMKGVGGFHLACDAMNPAAIARLRAAKHRPHKPLAVMVADVATARLLAHVDVDEAAHLVDPARPIVLCRVRDRVRGRGGLPAAIAPDTDEIGLMLPASPVHVALCAALAATATPHPQAMIMTSGNEQAEPLCAGNREALARLADVAELFLLHDRDIVAAIDDSVLRLIAAPDGHGRQVQPIRRARGYVPDPVHLPGIAERRTPPLIAWGADLKNTVCLTRGPQAFVSRHHGDVGTEAGLAFMREGAAHLAALLGTRPQVMLCDAHPNALSARHAEAAAQAAHVPLVRVQHHIAHGYAVLAEYAMTAPALALVLDGAGYGTDGTIWGGELLYLNPATEGTDQRLGHLRPFALPGGDAAVREPWRVARALLPADADVPLPWLPDFRHEDTAVAALLAAGLHPMTSSCGRLFDAVAALIGLCLRVTYEGQAAIRLERLAGLDDTQASALARDLPLAVAADLVLTDGPTLQLDSAALFARVIAHLTCTHDPAATARLLHLHLAAGLADMAARAAQARSTRDIVLSGGVMHNRIIAATLPILLRRHGLSPRLPRRMPPGDGGISLGQAYWLHCHGT